MGGDTESRLAALQPQASSSRSTVKSDINVVLFVLFFLSSFPFRSWISNKSLSDDIRLPKKFDLDDATMILSYRALCSYLLFMFFIYLFATQFPSTFFQVKPQVVFWQLQNRKYSASMCLPKQQHVHSVCIEQQCV